ncbi:glycolate oxidase subunit GlcF [Photobacterium sp. DNB23_23_1]
MLTELDNKYRYIDNAQEAVTIIKRCVHRGFCNATCPTFIDSGDQNRGPRGRIYLIRNFLQGEPLTAEQRKHLDLCLTCRSCETTCPAGIEFGKLISIARCMIDDEYPRPWKERTLRWAIKQVLPYPHRFSVALQMGQVIKPFLPSAIAEKIPTTEKNNLWPNSQPNKDNLISNQQEKKKVVILLTGCAQDTLNPAAKLSAISALNVLGIQVKQLSAAHCCGAIHANLADHNKSRQIMKNNINIWWPLIEQGAEAIISLSSSCELMVREYFKHLGNSKEYGEKAEIVSNLTKNIGEIILEEDEQLVHFSLNDEHKNLALHTPCSLRNGLKKEELPRKILSQLGATFSETEDNNICCGSGGTYSLLQPQSSLQLRNNKIKALTIKHPSRIVTSNLSCQIHIGSASTLPISHWIELLDVCPNNL